MNKFLSIPLFIILLFSLNFISADIISVNSGGDNELVITSDSFIEGFFSGNPCIPITCASRGYACGTLNNGCGVVLNCGVCGTGFTCSAGVCTGTTPGGDTGGGGEGNATNVTKNVQGAIWVSPSSMNITLAYNDVTNMTQRVTKSIYVTNTKPIAETVNISLEGEGLERIVFLPKVTSITLAPNETREITIELVSLLETRKFTGNISVGPKKIALFIDITPNPLWFDSNIVVLNKDYAVSQGGQLRTKVELIPMGDPSRLDVTLKYAIKDYTGKVFLTNSETLLVEKRMNVNRNFNTGKLPLGKYTISLDLIYPGGIAPSTAHFEVVQKTAGEVFGIILFFLVLAIIVVIAFLVFFLILKRRKREQEDQVEQETNAE